MTKTPLSAWEALHQTKEIVKFATECQDCGSKKEYKQGNPNDHQVCHHAECKGTNAVWVYLKESKAQTQAFRGVCSYGGDPDCDCHVCTGGW